MPTRHQSQAKAEKTMQQMRAEVIAQIAGHLHALEMPQGELAQAVGLTRPRLNRLLAEDVDLFSLDALYTIALRAGLRVKSGVMRSYPAK